MPVPTPGESEKRDAFIGRCHQALADEFTDTAQRNAVCSDAWREAHPSANEFVTLAVHLSGEVRTETLMGHDFTVVPAVLVQEQVLHNNLGRTFLPADEITQAWADTANGAPVLVDHPRQRGQPVSGRIPEILNQLGVGWLFDARADNGKIKADVWLDPARASEVPDLAAILERLSEHEHVELSTGFPIRSMEETPGAHNGREFDRVIRPAGFDHLAVFATKTGACSVTDGCGLGINHEGPCRLQEGGTPMDQAPDNTPADAEAATLARKLLNALTRLMSRADEPVPDTTEPASNADDPSPEEGNTMNRDQMIAHLAAAGRDKEVLNKLSDCDLKALVGAAPAPATNADPADPDERLWKEKALDYKRRLEEERAATAHARNEEAKRRHDMLEDLLYKGGAVAWSEQELKAMDIEALAKVHRQVFNLREDYTGQGGPRPLSGPVGNFDWLKPMSVALTEKREAN